MNVILYHANCPDGFTAAWAAWKKFGDHVTYRAMNYSDPVPSIVDGLDVLLVDFSFSRKLMDELSQRANSVTVFDHHKTAQADLADWKGGRVVFDMDRSGAGITWDELHPTTERPLLINYVEDRDLWRWKLLGSREISEYIFAIPRLFDDWDRLADTLELHFIDAAKGGDLLLQSKKTRVETVCQHARFVELGGQKIPVVNASWDMSEIGEYLCQKFPDAPCGGYYFDRPDKRQWGFRSRGDFDVSTLCKQYGGGGHRAAAGFTSEIGWWPLEEKTQ